MSGYSGVREAIRRVKEEASAARAYYNTWKTLDSARGDPQLLRTMNNHHYVDFFHVALTGNFCMSIVCLGKIYDKSRGSISMKYLVSNVDADDGQILREVCKRHGNTIGSLWDIRRKEIVHNDPKSIHSVFKSSQVKPDRIKSLIDDTCNVLNDIATKPEYSLNRIAGGSRNVKAVAYLLDFLQGSSLSVK